MTLTPLLMLLKKEPVKWILIGIAIVFICLPLISTMMPRLFYDKVEKGSYFDVMDMKEISWLSVQRLNFSNVKEAVQPKGAPLDKAEVYVRRIMRGHVTTLVDFSKIVVTNSIDGKFIIEFPELVAKPVIDEWIFYDSEGTGNWNPEEMTKDMNKAFIEEMKNEALKYDRVVRAKEQAECIVHMLYPDMKFESKWPQNPDAGTQSTAAETTHE